MLKEKKILKKMKIDFPLVERFGRDSNSMYGIEMIK